MYDCWRALALARYQRWSLSQETQHWKNADDLAGLSWRLAPLLKSGGMAKRQRNLLQIEDAQVVDEHTHAPRRGACPSSAFRSVGRLQGQKQFVLLNELLGHGWFS